MGRKLSLLISGVLHPFLMPTFIYYLILAFYFNSFLVFEGQALVGFLTLIFISTCLLPATSIVLLYKFGLIGDFNLIDRRDRYLPNLVVTLMYFITFCVFRFIHNQKGIIVVPIFCMSIALLINSIISFWWKISAHATGVGGVLGFWAIMQSKSSNQEMFYPFLFFLILVGGLLSSRLYLGRHTPAQVWCGLGIGCTISFLGLVVYFNLYTI